MMTTETLTFKISLTGTYWSKKPNFSIFLNDELIEQKDIENQSVHEIVFERGVAEDQEHELKIRLNNKQDEDTIIENTQIVKDMILNIDGIEIDDVDIGNLRWSAEYKLDQAREYNGKQTDHIDNCVNLGFNGTYTLKFTSPFYIWLLEKL
jgi:hypothetical protein